METNIPVYKPDLSGNEMKYLVDCVQSGWISSLGEYVTRFETDFASFCGVKHAVAVANGTTALHLCLVVCGIGEGNEIIVPSLTFVATANAVKHAGAEPVFIDVNEDTWTLDPDLLNEKITTKTKAILPVHLYGNPADMDGINNIAEEHGLYVIEDAAEALGAEYKGKRTGGLADLGCFSFYGNKTLTTGEGGMITTDDDDLAEQARFLKDHAMSKDKYYWHPVVGYNYRMTNLQAAIGVAQLERIDTILSRKYSVTKAYQEGLTDCPGIVLHPQAEWAKSGYWMYSIIITDDFPLTRDALRMKLLERGIDTRPFFYPMHQLPPYLEDEGNYPISDNLSRGGINLPSYPELTRSDINRVCEAIWELSE